jgi:hypothetical protein
MNIRMSVALLSVALIFSACSDGPVTAGELKGFDQICDKANDGKRLAVEGYLRFPESFTGTQSAVLRLYKAADLGGNPIGVQTAIGNQTNRVELPPKQYTDKDLKVHLTDGQVVGSGTKVRVSGKVYFPIVGQDFSCSLAAPLIEPAK